MTVRAARSTPETRSPRVLWLIPAALALHNVEEATTLPHYLPIVRARLPDVVRPMAAQVDVDALRLTLLWITLLALLVIGWAVWRPESRLARWCALAVQGVLALNVVSHVVVAIALLKGYGPGLVTALAVNAPLSIHLFPRARHERWIASWSWWLLPPAALLLHGPGLIGLLLLSRGRCEGRKTGGGHERPPAACGGWRAPRRIHMFSAVCAAGAGVGQFSPRRAALPRWLARPPAEAVL